MVTYDDAKCIAHVDYMFTQGTYGQNNVTHLGNAPLIRMALLHLLFRGSLPSCCIRNALWLQQVATLPFVGMQVNGGSQSFNVVNHLRTLGRWMRMVTVPNQSSVPKAWTEFDDCGRMKASSYRARVVDVAEELYKFTILLRDHSEILVDRFSERDEVRRKGRLLSQAEKEAAKTAASAKATLPASDTTDAVPIVGTEAGPR